MMKKYISVFEMITRSTLYKVLAVLVVMTGVQILLFWGEMQPHIDDKMSGLERIVDGSHMIWGLAAGFLLITVILCWSGCNIGSNQGYTLRRLQISETAVWVLQAIYNGLCYFLLWASQVAVLFVAGSMYAKEAANLTNQTIVLAFYRNAYMHSMLPLADGLGWFLLVLMLVGCAVATALFPYQQRRGKVSFGVIAIVATIVILFPRGLGDDLSFLVYYPLALLVGYGVYSLIMSSVKGEKKDE